MREKMKKKMFTMKDFKAEMWILLMIAWEQGFLETDSHIPFTDGI